MNKIEDIFNKDVKVVFGLEAQGHIPTIEAIIKRWNDSYKRDYPDQPLNMMYSKHVWDEIGKTIGWCPFTAALYYFEYLEENKSIKTLVEAAKELVYELTGEQEAEEELEKGLGVTLCMRTLNLKKEINKITEHGR